MSEQNMNGWINENENIPVEKTDEVWETAAEAAETVSDVSGNPGPAVQQSGYQAQMNQAAGAQQNFTGASQQSAAGAQQYHTGAAQQNFTGASQQNYTGAAQQGSAGAQQSAGFEQQRSGYGTQQQSAFHASQNEHRKTDTGYNPVKEKKKKPMTTGKKWVLTVCMALVFGLVAGVVMFGVNSIGNRMVGTDRISAEAEKAWFWLSIKWTAWTNS